jgi:hypothetical protein
MLKGDEFCPTAFGSGDVEDELKRESKEERHPGSRCCNIYVIERWSAGSHPPRELLRIGW